jgi:hypothetical protein
LPPRRGNVKVLQGKATEKERETMNRESKSAKHLVTNALIAREVRLEALENIRESLLANLEEFDRQAPLKPESVRELQLIAQAQSQAYRNALEWLKLPE